MGGGLFATARLPESNAVNFVLRIAGPKLLLRGRYDEELPWEPDAGWLFELMSQPKRLELVESGHLPPPELRDPIINSFLDETLGPVNR